MFAPATVFGQFNQTVAAEVGPALVEATARCTILATGAYERPILFPGNDRPGVMLLQAARRLLMVDGVLPGRRAIVVTDNDHAYPRIAALRDCGLNLLAVIDVRSAQAVERGLAVAPSLRSIARPSTKILGTLGRDHVRGVRVTHDSGTSSVTCDAVLMAGGWQPADELRRAATSHGTVLIESEGVHPGELATADAVSELLQGAGSVSGTFDAREAFLEGRVAALKALVRLGHADIAVRDQAFRDLQRARQRGTELTAEQ